MLKQGKHTPLIHSLGMKICLCVDVSILLTSIILLLIIVPRIMDNTSTTAKQYMYDMTVSYGESLDREFASTGKDKALDPTALGEQYSNAKVQCAESSYVYITDAQGTMLYHPTKEKIGKPVENEVVKGLVEKLQAGTIPKPDIITYEFKGEDKYAAYYIGGEGSYILVLTADESDIFSELSDISVLALIGVIVAFIVCGLFAIFLAKLIVSPIKKLTTNIEQLATLDFTEPENSQKLNKREDETGKMSQALSTLRTELVNVFSNINSLSKQLYNASDILKSSSSESTESVSQVEKAINEVAEGATSQAQETQKATENVILIGNMIEETGKQVEQLNNNAEIMKQSGDGAVATLKQLDDTNAKTRKAIHDIYEQTLTTNVSAAKIREATGMITAIAEETNLLSLNASIEAARAGEQGRGFAVVAAQIQKLAEQSNESTKLIEEIIESLIQDSDEAVKIMTEVKTVIEEQSVNVEQTGTGFASVKQGIDSSMQNMKAMHEIIDRMDEARVNVVDVVQSLTAIAEENAAATEETSASAVEVSASIQNMGAQTEQLERIAHQLEESMSLFKL